MIVRTKTLIKSLSIRFIRGGALVKARRARTVVVIVSRQVKVMKRCIAIGVKHRDVNIVKSPNANIMKNLNLSAMKSQNANAMRSPSTSLALAMKKSINNHTKKNLNF